MYNMTFVENKGVTGKGTSHGLFAKPLHEESYNVLEGEILMSLDKSKRYMDGNIHCFSFANGLGDDVSLGATSSSRL